MNRIYCFSSSDVDDVMTRPPSKLAARVGGVNAPIHNVIDQTFLSICIDQYAVVKRFRPQQCGLNHRLSCISTQVDVYLDVNDKVIEVHVLRSVLGSSVTLDLD